MIWAFLWKFKLPIGIATAVAALVMLTTHVIHKHDEGVAAKATQIEHRKQLGIESDYVDSVVADLGEEIDSLHGEIIKREIEKAKVSEHAKKLVKVQSMEQSSIDSFIAQARDSAVKIVVDSLDSKYRGLLVNMGEQVATANALADMAKSDSANYVSIIHDQDSQIKNLTRINKQLLSDLELPRVGAAKKESVGHFIVHKIGPVVALGTFVTVGVVKTVNELRDK